VLAAVSLNGPALKFASDELRADREIVLAAVRQNYKALRYVSDELRADREIVLEAVSLNGPALQYASPALRNDREIVLASYGLTMRRIGLFAVSVGVLIAGVAIDSYQYGEDSSTSLEL
jgi:hypothetical protein